MTLEITGPRRPAPWQKAIRALTIIVIIFSICLILLGVIENLLVDWLWFSAIGYFSVFWTTILAEAEVFTGVFAATAIILWVNGLQERRRKPSNIGNFRTADPSVEGIYAAQIVRNVRSLDNAIPKYDGPKCLALSLRQTFPKPHKRVNVDWQPRVDTRCHVE
jgi:hypothetical protein